MHHPDGIDMIVAVLGASMATGAGVDSPAVPESDMAPVLSCMADLQWPMPALEGRVSTMEAASTNFRSMVSHFD
jgi:hypothetical protein